MNLLLPPQIIKRLRRELRRATWKEIGGVLMGEHVRDEVFRVTDISIQRSGGTQACFIRDPKDHKAQLQEFFNRTGEDYQRFNYLGEWHSHPSFDAFPSSTDIKTMQSMLSDPDVGAHFLILLITKLSRTKGIETTVILFRPGEPPVEVPVLRESETLKRTQGTAQQWLRKLFRM
jgi:[CysO sulfur-carrier protein]-S-L-cysteine hydrolase